MPDCCHLDPAPVSNLESTEYVLGIESPTREAGLELARNAKRLRLIIRIVSDAAQAALKLCVKTRTDALDSTIEQTPVWMRGTLQRLSARAAARVLHGLPLQSFALERGLLSAFRSLQAGTNTGKVVILIPATAPAPQPHTAERRRTRQ